MSVVIQGGISIQGNITVGDVPVPLTFIVSEGVPDQLVAEAASGGDLLIEEHN